MKIYSSFALAAPFRPAKDVFHGKYLAASLYKSIPDDIDIQIYAYTAGPNGKLKRNKWVSEFFRQRLLPTILLHQTVDFIK